jgi:hypothetical protein
MRKSIAILASATLLAAGSALAAEFQPVGTLGIGGAGVARTYDANAPYWNPAGLAFNTASFSSRVGGGVGIRVNSVMADNVDRLGKLNIDNLTDLNLNSGGTPAQNLALTAKAAEFVGVLTDLDKRDGTLTVNADAVLGFQYGHFAMGGFSTMELASFASADTAAVGIGGVTGVNDFATAIGAGTATKPANSFFTNAQRATITDAFGGNTGITNALDSQFSSKAPVTGQTSQQLTDALVNMGQSLTSGGSSLQNNTSTLEYRGLALVEIPFSYGYPINLGNFGTLGVGATAKVMWGRAFIGESQIVKVKNSGDIVKNITDHYRDTTTFGVDLGALWRYRDWLNVGLVAKNLNGPEFDTPSVVLRTGANSAPIRVEPQVRTGVSLDPLSWLSVAADLDLTENDTILIGKKSRNIGGGVDLHPLTWFKLRGGIYKNLAVSDIGAVPTFGLTLGPKLFNFDLDGAVALQKGRFEEKEYPREARLQFSFNMQF